MDGVVPAGEGVMWSGGGSFLVSGTASICVWAVGMAQIQGTVPVGTETPAYGHSPYQRLVHTRSGGPQDW